MCFKFVFKTLCHQKNPKKTAFETKVRKLSSYQNIRGMEHTPTEFWTSHSVIFTLQDLLIISSRLSIIDEQFFFFPFYFTCW